jgi:hypothetical protein
MVVFENGLQLVPIHKWTICSISALREKFNPRNITICLRLNFSRAVSRPNLPISDWAPVKHKVGQNSISFIGNCRASYNQLDTRDQNELKINLSNGAMKASALVGILQAN